MVATLAIIVTIAPLRDRAKKNRRITFRGDAAVFFKAFLSVKSLGEDITYASRGSSREHGNAQCPCS